MARRASRETIAKNKSPEKRARFLFRQVWNLVDATKQKRDIQLITPDASDPDLRFKGITADGDNGDRIGLAMETRGWLSSHRLHGPRVLIGIEGQVKQPKTKTEDYFHQQFMIEKMDAYTYIYHAHSLTKGWERVEDWENKDPKDYVGFLEKLVAAATPRTGPVAIDG